MAQTLVRHLVRRASVALILRVGGVGFAFLLHITLTRLLPVTLYGLYALISAWLTLALLLVVGGTDTVIVRDVARGRKDYLHVAIRERRVLVLSAFVAGVVIMFVTLDAEFARPVALMWSIMFASLPALAFATLRQAFLRGAARSAAAMVCEFWIRPLTLLGVLGLVMLTGVVAEGPLVATTFLGAAILAASLAWQWSRRAMEPAKKSVAMPVSEDWTPTTPFFVIAIATLFLRQTDLVLVGGFLGAGQAALYAIAVRVADLCTLVLLASNVVLAPMLADLYAANRYQELRDLVHSATRLSMIVGFVVCGSVMLGAEWILSWFGPDYVAATDVLRVLVLGQLVATALGPAGQVLAMTGGDRAAARILFAVAVANIGVCAFAIAWFGVIGAAVSTLIAIIVWRVSLGQVARRRIDNHLEVVTPS